MADSLRSLARDLDIPERTLRRAAAQGLVHGRRLSERRFETTVREEAYLRAHWALLSRLRDALRTEPNVRLAVLFGSRATGRAVRGSDIDLLVELADGSAARVAELTGRLERRLDEDVQVVRLTDAERSPRLLADALRDGRVLVDRDGSWPALKRAEASWKERASRGDRTLEDAVADLDLA